MCAVKLAGGDPSRPITNRKINNLVPKHMLIASDTHSIATSYLLMKYHFYIWGGVHLELLSETGIITTRAVTHQLQIAPLDSSSLKSLRITHG